MTTTAPAPVTGPPAVEHLPLRHPRLPRWAPLLVVAAAAAGSGILALLLHWGAVAWAIVAALGYLVALPAWSRAIENRRAAKDRLVTSLVWRVSGVPRAASGSCRERVTVASSSPERHTASLPHGLDEQQL